MKRIKYGFTIIELVTAVAIIAILAGLLMPAMTAIRVKAMETSQKAQFASIDMAILAFKNDYGDYPPSDGIELLPSGAISPLDYCGAMKLAEAMVGWDLMGFHPDSEWRSDGSDGAGNPIYDSTNDDNVNERRGPYIELDKANAFKLVSTPGSNDGLYNVSLTGFPLAPYRYVLCDQFKVRKITTQRVAGGDTIKTEYKAGTPILYYRAQRDKNIGIVYGADSMQYNYRYNYFDNSVMCDLGPLVGTGSHAFGDGLFYTFDFGILDPKITGRNWPHNPDTYILISAGRDGLYGTKDDIHNW